MISSLFAVIAILVALSSQHRNSGLKDRLVRLEEALAELTTQMRWLRAERRGETPQDDGPLFAPDAGVARPFPAKPQSSSQAGATGPLPARDKAFQGGDVPKSGGSVPQVEPPQTPVFPPLDAGIPAPAVQQSLEQTLGTRWAVWAGGAALALGGLLLVRYSIEAGLLGPATRVALGALLALALVSGGEWMRRGEFKISVEAFPAANVPSILTAAGTVIAFGTIYAAHAVYGFIGPTTAFTLLGLTGILTLLAAALHAPWLAGLGLASSFATPLLVTSQSPSPWPVVLYLAVVAASAYALARVRHWAWLAGATVTGVFLWGLALLANDHGALSDSITAAASHTVIQLILASIFVGLAANASVSGDNAEPEPVASAAMSALGMLAIFVLASSGLSLSAKTIFADVCIAILAVTAWMSAPAAISAAVGGAIALAILLMWPGLSAPPSPNLVVPWSAAVLRLPENITGFMSFAMFATLLPAAAMALRLWRGPKLHIKAAALYALAATVPPLLALIVAYLRVTQFDSSISFALAGAALGAAFAVGSERFHDVGISQPSPAWNLAAGAFAAAAIAALAFALTVSLDRGYLTVALALAALGTAYVATLRDIPLLRYAVTALGVMVLARVVWDPRIMGNDVGATPIFNWLLIGYGVPAASFLTSARLLETRRQDSAAAFADALGILFAGLLAFFEIRHLTNGGNVLHAGFGHVEAGLMTLVALGFSLALARLNSNRSNVIFEAASLVFGAGGVALAAFGLALSANPLFSGEWVGGRVIFSSLMPAYLVPGLAALYMSRAGRGIQSERYLRVIGAMAVALITLFVTLEVRHAYQGPEISIDLPTTDSEQWAHSFAWLVLGVAYLSYGLLRGSLEARIASAVLIILAALKITLFDLAGIGGLWRALSFLCLGAVLIGIGLVYQKIVFAPAANAQK